MEAYRERLKYFKITLSTREDDLIFADPIIDTPRFREMCFYGIPDEPGLRQKAWKVLLGYLPPDKRQWPEILVQQRKAYYNWLKDLLVDPGEDPPDQMEDHPLNAAPDSKWATYFADNAILEQIDKDVRRTLPDFAFFQLPVPRSPLNPLSPLQQFTGGSSGSDETNSENEADDEGDGDGENEVVVGPLESDFPAATGPRSGSSASKRSRFGSTSEKSVSTPTIAITTLPIPISPRPHLSPSPHEASPQERYEILSSPIPTRRSLFKRIAHLNKDFGAREHQAGNQKAAKRRSKFHDAFEERVHNADKAAGLGGKYPVIMPSRAKPKAKVKPKQTASRSPSRRASEVELQAGEEANGDRDRDGYENGDEDGDSSDPGSDSETGDLHWEAIERILFIYAKLNPGVGYVQGMNELLGPIYYLFARDTSAPDTQAHAEADSFFAFTHLMSDVRDHFVRSLDDDPRTGINASMARMARRLRWCDEELWQDLAEVKEVKEQYYAFRWITVLGTQEWSLPDVIRLWDSVLADRGRRGEDGGTVEGEEEGGGTGEENGRFDFFMDFCVAMVVCVRDQLLAGDFSENIKLLQNYPINDIAQVLQRAYEIRNARATEAAEAAAAAAFEARAQSPESDDPLSILGIPNPRTRPSSSSSTAVSGSPLEPDDDEEDENDSATPANITPGSKLPRRLFEQHEGRAVNWDTLRKESLDEILKGFGWRGGAGANAAGTKPGLERKTSGGSTSGAGAANSNSNSNSTSNPHHTRPTSVILPPSGQWGIMTGRGNSSWTGSMTGSAPTSPTRTGEGAREWLLRRRPQSQAQVQEIDAGQRKGVDGDVAALAISVLAAGGSVPVTEREQQGGFASGWGGGFRGRRESAAEAVGELWPRRESVGSSTSNGSGVGAGAGMEVRPRRASASTSLLGRMSRLVMGERGENGEEENPVMEGGVQRFQSYEYPVYREEKEEEGGIPRSVVEKYGYATSTSTGVGETVALVGSRS
ncbi:rab-GTPase-TBC domain-containing protein, partial [Jimgerdemannia flammicorona]